MQDYRPKIVEGGGTTFTELSRKQRSFKIRELFAPLARAHQTPLDYIASVPGLAPLYGVWQDLIRLLRMKKLNQKDCRKIIPEYLWIVEELRQTPFAHL